MEQTDDYDYCPCCGNKWEDNHQKDQSGNYVCDERGLLEANKPRFYLLDLSNYNSDFLREIIMWQDKKIKYLEKKEV